MSWHDTFSRVSPYVVKIETTEGYGTGFFFAYNSDKSVVAIATALHVIEHAHDWRLPIKLHREGRDEHVFLPFEDRAVLIDRSRDSAAILVSCTRVTAPDTMLKLTNPGMYKKVGVDLGWAGYPAIASSKLCLFRGSISAFDLDDDHYLLDGVAINGVSGGPVFDEQLGESAPLDIVGIVSAYYPNRQSSGTLPGLAIAYDVTHLHATITSIKSLDEARQLEEAEKQGPQDSPAPETPAPVPSGPQK